MAPVVAKSLTHPCKGHVTARRLRRWFRGQACKAIFRRTVRRSPRKGGVSVRAGCPRWTVGLCVFVCLWSGIHSFLSQGLRDWN